MSRGLINRLRFSMAGLLLLIFSAYYVSSTLFYHQHTLEGETIFHSHFSTKSHRSDGSSDGGHTLKVAKLIAQLNRISIEEQEFNNHVEAPLARLESIARVESTAAAKFYVARTRSLRAPPAIAVIA